jgi:O-antigen/teichoic acid export membrane protein
MFGAKILSMIISLIATAVIARGLGPTNFGQLSYAVSFVGLFAFLYSLGIDSILYRELIRFPEKKKELLGSAFFIKISTGIVTALIINIVALFTATCDVSQLLILIISGTFLFNSFQVINYEFQSRVQSKYPSIASLLVTLILNILKVGVIMSGQGVIYLAFILLLESILYAFSFWFIYQNTIGGKISDWKFSKEITISLIKDSWPLIFTGVFAMIYARIDQVLIKQMLDTASVGIYSSAVQLSEVWYFIPNIIVSSFFPAIINAKKTSPALYKSRVWRLAMFLFILSLLISIPISIFAPMIINLLYGEMFLPAVNILRIYIWSLTGTFLINLATQYLIAENRRKSLLFLNLIPMVVNVILNIIWIPIYGIAGAAFATLISYSLGPVFIVSFDYVKNNFFRVKVSDQPNLL